jgi:hypothetical protein
MKNLRFKPIKKLNIPALISDRLIMPCNRRLISQEFGINIETGAQAVSPAFISMFFSFSEAQQNKLCKILGGIYSKETKAYYENFRKQYNKTLCETLNAE